MKKLIPATLIILALTIAFTVNTQAQGRNPGIYVDDTDQSWPSVSGLLIAYHDLPTEPGPWEKLDIYEILNFIDASIEKGSLLGYGSSEIAADNLNVLKTRIKTAANIMDNGTFEEACLHLLDAYLSADGLSEPPDLVHGEAAPELAQKIKLMRIEIIGCE